MEQEEGFKVCPICGRKIPDIEPGPYWAYPKDRSKSDLKVVYVDKVGCLHPIENTTTYLAENWNFIQKITSPDLSKDFNEEIKKKAIELKDNLEIRKVFWLEWIDRNSDVLDVGTGFIYRLGFECFTLMKSCGRVVPHYQRMASQDHNIRDTVGDPIAFKDWDVGIFDIWEKLYPKLFPVMERVIRDRWFRRDGTWNGNEARYRTDITIFKGLSKK
jgi:hypothetical protein